MFDHPGIADNTPSLMCAKVNAIKTSVLLNSVLQPTDWASEEDTQEGLQDIAAKVKLALASAAGVDLDMVTVTNVTMQQREGSGMSVLVDSVLAFFSDEQPQELQLEALLQDDPESILAVIQSSLPTVTDGSVSEIHDMDLCCNRL